jgi:hypothetical protein
MWTEPSWCSAPGAVRLSVLLLLQVTRTVNSLRGTYELVQWCWILSAAARMKFEAIEAVNISVVVFWCDILCSDTKDRDGQFMVDNNIWHTKSSKGVSFLGLEETHYLALFQASATAQMRSSLFWVVTRRFIVSHRRFGTTYLSRLGRAAFLDCLTLEDGTDRLFRNVGN